MSKVAQIRHFEPVIQAVIYQHQLQQKAVDSWWVFRSEVGNGSQLSPYSRVVFFARTEKEALEWVSVQESAAEIGQTLAMSA